MISILKSCSMILLVMTVTATVVSPSVAIAQGTTAEKPPVGGPRRQLGTIIYAGLGGAVLGLSTLSFYGRPQDKLANIAIGFAVGVIAGTAAVTYTAATNPDEFYGYSDDGLGPAPQVAVISNRRTDESSSVLSASFEVFKF